MRMIWLAAALALAGCSASGGFVGSPHGMCGSIQYDDLTADACPTIVPEGGKEMGYRKNAAGDIENMYSTYSDGSVRATGPAADILAEAVRFEKRMLFCAVAPDAQDCGGAPLE